jgi:hypothetical protein
MELEMESELTIVRELNTAENLVTASAVHGLR